MASVYIVDDESSIRQSTSFLLRSAGYHPRAFVSAADFLDEMPALEPGVVLLDIRMPEMDGLALVERLPPASTDLFPVVIVTGHGDMDSAVNALRLGVRDFLEKPFEEAELLQILRRLTGEVERQVANSEHRDYARAKMGKLTSREREVLALLAEGKPNKTVAYELDLSTRTVEMHRSQMLDRLGVRTLPEAIRLAIAAGSLA